MQEPTPIAPKRRSATSRRQLEDLLAGRAKRLADFLDDAGRPDLAAAARNLGFMIPRIG